MKPRSASRRHRRGIYIRVARVRSWPVEYRMTSWASSEDGDRNERGGGSGRRAVDRTVSRGYLTAGGLTAFAACSLAAITRKVTTTAAGKSQRRMAPPSCHLAKVKEKLGWISPIAVIIRRYLVIDQYVHD